MYGKRVSDPMIEKVSRTLTFSHLLLDMVKEPKHHQLGVTRSVAHTCFSSVASQSTRGKSTAC